MARAVDLPLLVSDAPDRSRISLDARTVERLAALRPIVGIEDASGDLARVPVLARAGGDRLVLLCGRDAQAVAHGLAGGHGSVSAVANVFPSLCSALRRSCKAGRLDEGQALQDALRPLIAALEREPEPASVKHALSRVCPFVRPSVRLPLVPVEDGAGEAILTELERLRASLPVDAVEAARRRP